jgi:hypothetical protein
MRFILALALVPLLSAQSREESIARGEAALKQHPENLSVRGSLLRLYFENPDTPVDAAAKAGRRRQIFWLIENRPEAPDLATFFGVIEATGPKADPEGREEEARLWRAQIAKPDAGPKTLANAAWFFKLSDRDQARALVERALQNDPKSQEAARMRGILDVLTWFGATQLERGDTVGRYDPELHKSDAAAQAFAEIESSQNPALLGGAAQFLLGQYGRAFDDAIGATTGVDIATRWAAKAHELDLENPALRGILARAYQRQAGDSVDPRWKAQLLAKVPELAANDGQKGHYLADLAYAEYLAADDSSAARDARTVLGIGKDDYAIHTAHTVLGSLAEAQGRMDDARQELLASARIKAQIAPRMTLAQDLLDEGQRDAVVEYLDLCRAFWKNDAGFLNHFEPEIKAGKKPDLTRYSHPNPAPKPLPAPEVEDAGNPRWSPVAGAESYVVEWDTQQNGRWMSDVDGSVRVIPTTETSAKLEARGKVRWRVYAVGRFGAGQASGWQTAGSR